MSEMILAVLTYMIGVAWYGGMLWISGSGMYWMWRDKKSQPLQARINRLSYEIELIEGDKFKQTPESTALRRARDLDSLELMDFESHTEQMLRTWGAWRWIKRDPYSPTERWKISKRAELRKNLKMDT
jgi:hypothetical protein